MRPGFTPADLSRFLQQDTIVDLGFDFAEEESLRFFVD